MKENNDVFCVLPWIHLATHPIGTVTPCCITDMTNAVSTAAKEHDTAQHLFLSKDTLDFNEWLLDINPNQYCLKSTFKGLA